MRELTVRLFVPHPLAASECAELLARAAGIRLTSHCRFDVGVLDAASFTGLPALPPQGPREIKILVLVRSASDSECLRWLAQGARGVLAYGDCAEHLAPAVRQIADGQLWGPAEVIVRWILTGQARRATTRFPGLTGRQAEVARLLLAGSSNKEIAQALKIGVSTVKFHVLHIFEKAGVHSRADLVSLWVGAAPPVTAQ
jgi:DNA-binding NarL/FixJ family response regulator